MADDILITQGSGTTVKTDDVGGKHVQFVKIMDGTSDGTGQIAGDATYGLDVDVTRLPTLANVTTLGTITNVVHVDDNSGTLTVDGTVTANLSATDNAVLDVIAAGYGAESTALGSGVLLQGDDGTDRTNVLVDTSGHLQVDVLTAPTTAVTGPLTDTQLRATAVPISVATIPSHNVTNAGTFAVQAAQSGTWNVGTVTSVTNVVHVDDNASTLSIDDGGGAITVDGTVAVTGATNTEYAEGATDTSINGIAVMFEGDVATSTLRAVSNTYPLPVSDAGGALTVDGTVAVSSVSGTVAATQSGTWNVATVSAVTSITNAVAVTDNNSTLSVDDGAGSLTVDGTVVVSSITNALPAGTNAIGKLSANSGVDIGDVDVTSVITGTGATNLGKAVSSAKGATDTGVQVLGIRDDTLSVFADAENDYEPLHLTSTGRLYASALIDTALPAGDNNIGNVDVVTLPTLANVTTLGTITNVVHVDDNAGSLTVDGTVAISGSVAVTNADMTTVAGAVSGGHMQVDVLSGGGGGTQYTEGDTDTTITGTAIVFEQNTTTHTLQTVSNTYPLPISDAGGAITVDGTVTANTGLTQPLTDTQLRASAVPVSLASVPSHAVTNAGTFATQVTSIAAGDNNIGNVDIVTMPTVTVNAHAVTNAGTFAVQESGAALTALQLIDNMISGNEAQVDIVASLPAGTNNIGKVDSPITTPNVYNVTLTNADTEYSQALPTNCRYFEFQCRSEVAVRYAFATGKVATPTAPWLTLKAGDSYSSPQIAQASSPSTLYLGTDSAGAIVEILAWT